jgi:hypothetical protein
VTTPINGMDYLALQTTAPPTDDPRVRRAIRDALDLVVIEKAFHRLNPPGGAFLPPVLPWHDASLASISQNDAAAASELSAAGWREEGAGRTKAGAPLDVLIVSPSGVSSEFATIVQRELSAVGMRATIKTFPAAEFNGPDGPLRTGRFNSLRRVGSGAETRSKASRLLAAKSARTAIIFLVTAIGASKRHLKTKPSRPTSGGEPRIFGRCSESSIGIFRRSRSTTCGTLML